MAIPESTAAAATSAVDALLNWKNKQTDSHNPQLLPQDDFIYLNLTLKKIPQKGGINGARTNPNKIPLPHPLISPNSSELCLIIDDRPNSKLTSEIAKKKIKADGISITKVIKLSKLKTDYKPFESKRKLCDSYDMFFADKRVIPLLPKLLGKQFFKKKKLPLPVELSHNNWKEQIERGCGSGLLFFRTGTCSVVRVGKVSMERDEIVDNVKAAIEGVLGFVPKKLGGVRALHLKFSDSVALPLYQSLPDIRLKIEGIQERCEFEEGGEKKEAKKGRIHEVSLDMDVDEAGVTEKIENNEDGEDGEDNEDKDLGSVDLEVDEGEGSDKKKRKGDGIEVVKKKRSKKEKIREASDDLDVKRVKKSLKQNKRKGDASEESDVKTKSSEKVAKKKGKKQIGDSGKKEKKKVRSVSRV